MRHRLIAAAALAPLLAAAAAGQTRAEVVISGTPPFSTSKANDDLKNASGTTITATTAAPIIVTVDSNHKINNEGSLLSTDIDNSRGIVVQAGFTGFVRNTGSITVNDTYTRADTDSDGDLDGVFAKGTNRIGIHVAAGGTFTGNGAPLLTGGTAIAILNAATGSVVVEGDASYGILTESNIVGSVVSLGAVSVNGDKSGGIAIKGNVSGDVRAGAVTVRGVGSTGVTIDGDVGGKVNISGSISTTAYSFTGRPNATQLGVTEDDDKGQGGVALSIAGSVAGGILLSAPPTASETDTDVDDDGVPDASQGVAAVTTFGSAPAVQIGSSTRDITIGNVGATADTAFGFVTQGAMAANGVYDNVDTVALVVGGAGKAVNLNGGINNLSTTSGQQAIAFEANATAMSIRSGASMGEIRNGGTISSLISTATASDQSRAIDIQAGAKVDTITNTGSIIAASSGLTGVTRAITDASGTVSKINNTGAIVASISPPTGVTGTVTGTLIAIDASANTTGLAVTSSQSAVKDSAAPAIVGDIYFGSGADSLTVSAGTVVGAMNFGAGADALTISGDTTAVTGAVRDDGTGGLSIAVNSGKLSVSNAEVIQGSSLTLGAKSALIVSADPLTASKDSKNAIAVTHIQVADANIAGGAQVGLTLQNLVTETTKLTVISASNSMTLGGPLGTTVLENAPFLYKVTSSADTAAREVYLTVARRTTVELGFNAAQAAAYDAVFSALTKDKGIQGAILAQTSQAGLSSLYNQLLPSQGEGVFSALDASMAVVGRMIDERPDVEQRIGGDSLWMQEINQRVDRDGDQTLGSRARLLGVVGGYESMSVRSGALGVTLGYYNVEDNDDASAVGEVTSASLLEVGAYYRLTPGNFRFAARLAGGYAWFDSTRRFVFPGVVREAESNWTAAFATAHLGAAYEARFGRYYARPELTADYLYLREDAQQETGGGDGFNLAIEARSSDRLTAAAILTLGAQYGRTTWLRPEFRVGYRMIANGQIGATIARFTGSTGGPFTMVAEEDEGGWMIAGFSLKGGTELSYAALEGDAEIRDGEQRYNIRIAGRAMF